MAMPTECPHGNQHMDKGCIGHEPHMGVIRRDYTPERGFFGVAKHHGLTAVVARA